MTASQDSLSAEAVLYGRLLPGPDQKNNHPEDGSGGSDIRLGQNQLRILRCLSVGSAQPMTDIEIHQQVEQSGAQALKSISGVMKVLDSLRKHKLVEKDGYEWELTTIGRRALDDSSI